MSTIAKEPAGGTNIEPIPEGMRAAVCCWLIDLGTHWVEPPPGYSGTAKWTERIMIAWEFHDFRIKFERDGQELDLPRVISQEFTLSLHQRAKLRQWLKKWRNRDFTPEELKGFALKNILGANCTLQIINNIKGDRTYSNIESILPLVNAEKKTPENDIIHYDMDVDMSIPDKIPDWIKGKIMQSREWLEAFEPSSTESVHGSEQYPPVEKYEDEIPF